MPGDGCALDHVRWWAGLLPAAPNVAPRDRTQACAPPHPLVRGCVARGGSLLLRPPPPPCQLCRPDLPAVGRVAVDRGAVGRGGSGDEVGAGLAFALAETYCFAVAFAVAFAKALTGAAGGVRLPGSSRVW